MKRLAVISLFCAALAGALGGAEPYGRLAMSVGMPRLAARLFTDPEWQGAAYMRAGDYAAAAQSFDRVKSTYNLGVAQAFLGEHAAALESFDIAIAQGHPDAQANFDVVAAYYAGLGIDAEALGLIPKRKSGPTEESFVARGNARAAGSGSEVTNANTMLGLAELDSKGRLGVRRIFDDKFMVADERWLTQLADVPGEYLKARITHEHKRRAKAGLSPPPAEDPR